MEIGLEIANRDRYRNRQINRNALKIITRGFTKAVIINPCYRYRDRGSQRLVTYPRDYETHLRSTARQCGSPCSFHYLL